MCETLAFAIHFFSHCRFHLRSSFAGHPLTKNDSKYRRKRAREKITERNSSERLKDGADLDCQIAALYAHHELCNSTILQLSSLHIDPLLLKSTSVRKTPSIE